MSQEEHILHTSKEMREWTDHADRQLSRVKWGLYGTAALSAIIFLILLFR
jgi:hypothetical protein